MSTYKKGNHHGNGNVNYGLASKLYGSSGPFSNVRNASTGELEHQGVIETGFSPCEASGIQSNETDDEDDYADETYCENFSMHPVKGFYEQKLGSSEIKKKLPSFTQHISITDSKSKKKHFRRSNLTYQSEKFDFS